jgi:hypothetical protein
MSSNLTIHRPDGPGILFSQDELACRDGSGGRLHPGFSERLALLRMTWGRSMQVFAQV